jgi:hypothetical protein
MKINEKILFENACDFLKYGYGFKSFLTLCDMAKNDPITAKKMWKIAFEKMASDF